MRTVLEQYIKSDIEQEHENLVANVALYPNKPHKLSNIHIMSIRETELMKQIADVVVQPNGKLLNVGYGLGLFDKQAQKIGVSDHTIIECHPQVVDKCTLTNVELITSTWQDAVPKLIQEKKKFDTIYFDTYIFNADICFEDEWLNFAANADQLLEEGGTVSFFTHNFPEYLINKLKNKLTHLTEHEKFLNVDRVWNNSQLLYWTK